VAGELVEKTLGDGAKPRADLEDGQMTRLLEGALLAAKDTYEERKLPLLANLLATAPFTATPLPNLVGTLQVAESLTYRQLCILAVIRPYVGWPIPTLTTKNLVNLFGQEPLAEATEGVLSDLVSLVGQNLVVHAPGGAITAVVTGDLIPAEMVLTHPGRLLYNGLRLGAVANEDLADAYAVLGVQDEDRD